MQIILITSYSKIYILKLEHIIVYGTFTIIYTMQNITNHNAFPSGEHSKQKHHFTIY